MSLRTQMESDIADVFLNTTDDLTESVVYRPLHGAPRTIEAHVFRSPPGRISELDRSAIHEFVLIVEDHATRGITLQELDKGGDQIDLAEREGDTELVTKQIGTLLSSGVGALKFEVH